MARKSPGAPRFEAFQTFAEPSLAAALDAARQFAADLVADPWRHGRTVTFCGRSGLGKTLLSRMIFTECGWDAWKKLSKVGQRVEDNRLQNREGLLFDWRRTCDKFKTGDYSAVERMEEPLLLGIDDIGAEHDPSKVAASKLDRILRTRTRRWNLLTSNFTLEQIAENLDTRIASFLIRDGNKVIEMEGEDFWLR